MGMHVLYSHTVRTVLHKTHMLTKFVCNVVSEHALGAMCAARALSTSRTRIGHKLSRAELMVRSSVVVFTSFRLVNSVRVLVRLVFTSRELEIKTAARVGTRMYEFMRSNNS